jgi:hypothetical protein
LPSRVLLVVLTVALVVNALWTPLVLFFALLAESGGKDPSFVIAALEVWALVEIIRTWRWARRASRSEAAPSRRAPAVAVALASLLVLRPGLDYAASAVQPWERSLFVVLALVIGACYGLRQRHTVTPAGAGPEKPAGS